MLAHATGLEVRYPGGTHALGPMDFSLSPGEIVAILGPSGCGKSTLLSVLAGLLHPSAGQITRGATDPGVVFQDPTLLPWLSIAGNVALPLELQGLSKDVARERAEASLAMVGLKDFARAKPAALSGGMRMRAALARALVANPALLLLDEPFAAIDELGRRALDDLLLQLKAERGFAVFFVTHSVEEAVYLADRVVVLTGRPGRVAAEIPVAGARGDAFFQSDAFRNAAAMARKALRGDFA